jgi:predicted phage terminase large subunit-like protein
VALGSAAYAGQYQQRPAPAGGLLFHREWFKFYNELPPVETWLHSWDMTFKDSASSDYVVGFQAACQGADIYLIDRRKGQWAFTETCWQVLELRRRYPETEAILIEDAANGPAIINVLARQVPGIIGVTPEGGKYARAQAASPLVEAGNVWLPNPRPHGRLLPERAWVDEFLHECCVFPRGAHDDDVDAFTQLVARCVQVDAAPLRLVTGSDSDGGEDGETFVARAIRRHGQCGCSIASRAARAPEGDENAWRASWWGRTGLCCSRRRRPPATSAARHVRCRNARIAEVLDMAYAIGRWRKMIPARPVSPPHATRHPSPGVSSTRSTNGTRRGWSLPTIDCRLFCSSTNPNHAGSPYYRRRRAPSLLPPHPDTLAIRRASSPAIEQSR